MRYFQTVEEILDFAIKLEECSKGIASYLNRQTLISNAEMDPLHFDEQENVHIKTLQAFKHQDYVASLLKAVGLKIADYSVYAGPIDYSEMKFKDILSIAIKNETACMKLYTNLSKLSVNQNLTKQFQLMAAEEAQHRHMFQSLYDRKIRNSR